MVATFSPLVAEALAIRFGIQLTCDNGLVPFHFESDSLQAVELVCKGNFEDTVIGPVLAKISNLLKELPNYSISYVPRTENVAAHVLAKKALVVESDYRWFDCCPPCVVRTVQSDASF
ncbi:hypothetical protein Q3G72_024465 [Acer saccharum]|nr:hypothetical protein Q3G72_024465 [Acer saccharum]